MSSSGLNICIQSITLRVKAKEYLAKYPGNYGINSLPSSERIRRGVYPKELLAIGLREYREIFFKPYRIIYRIMAENVFVMVIADGRRVLQTLLQRRLLQA